MSSDNWNHEFFNFMKTEHKELTKVLANVRDALSAKNSDKIKIQDSISRLCELVESHFRHEERGGYLQEALDRTPQFSAQADVLLDQHETLLEEVVKLRLLIRSGVESRAWWARIESDFDDFASRLLDHEHAENELLQAAFTDDIGTGD